MRKDFMKKQLKGSHTAEAAVLLPLGIGLILFLVSCSLILHDRVVLSTWIAEAAQQAAFQKESRKERNTEKAVTEEQEAERIMVAGLVSRMTGSVERTGKTVKIVCSGRGGFASPFVKAIFFLKEPELEGQKQVQLLYGEDIVRKRRR